MGRRRNDTIKTPERRLQIEATLAEYPQVTPDRILDVIHWFKREATAHEVASIAKNPDIGREYQQFRKKHLNGLTAGELVMASALGVVLIVAVAVAIVVP